MNSPHCSRPSRISTVILLLLFTTPAWAITISDIDASFSGTGSGGHGAAFHGGRAGASASPEFHISPIEFDEQGEITEAVIRFSMAGGFVIRDCQENPILGGAGNWTDPELYYYYIDGQGTALAGGGSELFAIFEFSDELPRGYGDSWFGSQVSISWFYNPSPGERLRNVDQFQWSARVTASGAPIDVADSGSSFVLLALGMTGVLLRRWR